MLKYKNIKRLILEKPLGLDPPTSKMLLSTLINSNKEFRIGYSFKYTNWGISLLKCLSDTIPNNVKIEWNFLAHHYLNNINNWKRNNNEGGGVIRFYGIHIIALLGQFEYCKVIWSKCLGYSKDDIYEWHALFEIDFIHKIEIKINSYSLNNSFIVNAETFNNEMKIAVELNEPFQKFNSVNNDQDNRVENLKRVLDSLDDGAQNTWNIIYKGINDIWSDVESANVLNLVKQ